MDGVLAVGCHSFNQCRRRVERAKEVRLEAPQRLRLWQELHGAHDLRRGDRPRQPSPVNEGRGDRDEATLQLLRHEHHVVHDVRLQVKEMQNF